MLPFIVKWHQRDDGLEASQHRRGRFSGQLFKTAFMPLQLIDSYVWNRRFFI